MSLENRSYGIKQQAVGHADHVTSMSRFELLVTDVGNLPGQKENNYNLQDQRKNNNEYALLNEAVSNAHGQPPRQEEWKSLFRGRHDREN